MTAWSSEIVRNLQLVLDICFEPGSLRARAHPFNLMQHGENPKEGMAQVGGVTWWGPVFSARLRLVASIFALL
jgi:hypothetical protein